MMQSKFGTVRFFFSQCAGSRQARREKITYCGAVFALHGLKEKGGIH